MFLIHTHLLQFFIYFLEGFLSMVPKFIFSTRMVFLPSFHLELGIQLPIHEKQQKRLLALWMTKQCWLQKQHLMTRHLPVVQKKSYQRFWQKLQRKLWWPQLEDSFEGESKGEGDGFIPGSFNLFRLFNFFSSSFFSCFKLEIASFLRLQVSSSTSLFLTVSWIFFSFSFKVFQRSFKSPSSLQISACCAFRDLFMISHSFVFFWRFLFSPIVCCSKLLLDFSRDFFSFNRFSASAFI